MKSFVQLYGINDRGKYLMNIIEKIILHYQAVDNITKIWVNEKYVEQHKEGKLLFHLIFQSTTMIKMNLTL